MKIFLDGQEYPLIDATNKSLATIIEAMGLKVGHLAVRINQKYIPQKDVFSHILKTGDNVELVNIYAGG